MQLVSLPERSTVVSKAPEVGLLNAHCITSCTGYRWRNSEIGGKFDGVIGKLEELQRFLGVWGNVQVEECPHYRYWRLPIPLVAQGSEGTLLDTVIASVTPVLFCTLVGRVMLATAIHHSAYLPEREFSARLIVWMAAIHFQQKKEGKPTTAHLHLQC